MLQAIRDRAQSWIAIAIIGMLILALAAFAWDAYFGPDPKVSVASVDGEKILQSDFQQAYQRERARLQAMLPAGTDINQLIPDDAEFKKNILQSLINEQLIYKSAQDAAYSVSDQWIRQQIQGYEGFTTDGRFDRSLYDQFLRQQGATPSGFEAKLRRDELVNQYRAGIGLTAWVTPAERDRVLSLQQQRRNLGYAVVPVAKFMDSVQVSDAELQKYYDANREKFVAPERVSISYVELAAADLIAEVKVTEEAIQELYKERQGDFGAPEERRVRHILFEAQGADEAAFKKAASQAAEVLKQIRGGATFVEMAKKYSNDIGSAASGGDLGFLSRDAMLDASFAQVAFALNKNEISEPVKTRYGYHLIQLLDIKAGKVKPYAEVRAQLEHDYRQREAEEMFFDRSEQLTNLSYETPDSLEPAAKQLQLPIKATPAFSRDGLGALALDPKVRDAAFSEDVLRGNNSDPVEVGPNHVIVLRVNEHLPEKQRTLDEVKIEVLAQLRQDKAEAAAKLAGEALLAKLNAGIKPADVVKAEALSWQALGLVQRGSGVTNPEVLTAAFRMPRPEAGKPSFVGKPLSSGDYALIGVFDVVDVDLAQIDEAQKQELNKQRQNAIAISEIMGAQSALKKKAEIKEFPENF